MATIAAVFHWPLATMEDMPIEELMTWHELAIERWNRMWGGAGDE